jgi:hypothetical protein
MKESRGPRRPGGKVFIALCAPGNNAQMGDGAGCRRAQAEGRCGNAVDSAEIRQAPRQIDREINQRLELNRRFVGKRKIEKNISYFRNICYDPQVAIKAEISHVRTVPPARTRSLESHRSGPFEDASRRFRTMFKIETEIRKVAQRSS